ncbi:MAG: DNA-binding protein [Acidobacteria bacterium 13_1_20CM_3_53_8]|nr:MAG: DNA-binding protein [Acidobacteria bacterium 13_1_20CM_3_53_8]
MNRADFQKLAGLRIKEAKVLLDRKHYEGAYYLAGYAVECALKACVAKKTKRYDFPPNEKAVREFYYTHELEKLVKGADLGGELKAKEDADGQFKLNWAAVKSWKEQARYEPEIDEKRARDLYSAITNKKHGVLSWLKKYW